MTRQEFESFIDAVVILRKAVDNNIALKAVAAYPKYKEETIYEVGERVVYEGSLYEVIKTTKSRTATPDKSANYSLVSPQE